jgi:hypothetical protein
MPAGIRRLTAWVCVPILFYARSPLSYALDCRRKDACFIVRDHNGQALAYVYFEDEPGRNSAADLLTRDEARRIPVNIAKLPELLVRPQY